MDTHKSDEAESVSFETIAPEKDNPVRREFEIGKLGNQELKENEITRDETGNGSPGNTKPSQRKF
ncbi:hypothetical protein Q1W71_04135 [Flavobacterium pectinovorum]|uniref:hypothetical protein n=1 Tax=Flavobacterium pectinovorum TaxID=29533 RepID=UPI00265F28A4|nr:hypothetical protein [Flavobacterium pectinovorum]WKL48976.1 hypothetical protein Q1W71_04135 [Flavobacterium pectinovorum]